MAGGLRELGLRQTMTLDPYLSLVTSLLSFEGVDAATATTDFKTGNVWTFNGSAQIDTADKQFGVSSLLLPASTNSYLSCPNNAGLNLESGDFQVEGFVKTAATPNGSGLLTTFFNGSAVRYALAFCTGTPGSAGGDRLFFGWYNGGWQGIVAPSSFPTGAWTHVAVSRSGNVFRLFINGTIVASGTLTTPVMPTNTTETYLGRRWDGGGTPCFEGWMDEWRITKAARNVANFTAPSSPYPRG